MALEIVKITKIQLVIQLRQVSDSGPSSPSCCSCFQLVVSKDSNLNGNMKEIDQPDIKTRKSNLINNY